MNFSETALQDVFLIQPEVFRDSRGTFMEMWSERTFDRAGFRYDFVQDNCSFSRDKGILRGLHFQRGEYSQGKLVQCLTGAVLDVAVDLRPYSRTYKQWLSIELSAENNRQLLIPRGFAHGFLTLTDHVRFFYKADRYYCPEEEAGIRWDDPDLNIQWGIQSPILSDKDRNNPFLRDICTGF